MIQNAPADTLGAFQSCLLRPQYMVVAAENGYIVSKQHEYPYQQWVELSPEDVAARLRDLLSEG